MAAALESWALWVSRQPSYLGGAVRRPPTAPLNPLTPCTPRASPPRCHPTFLHPGLPVYALYNLFNSKSLGYGLIAYFCCASFVLGIVEIPMLCACYEWCQTVARVTRPIAGLWVGRAAVHILVTAGILGIALHESPQVRAGRWEGPGPLGRRPEPHPSPHSHTRTRAPLPPPHQTRQVTDPYMYVFASAFIFSALCYLVGALYKREPGPFDDDKSAGKGAAASGSSKEGSSSSSSSGSSAAEDAGGFFGRLLAKKAVENPAATTAFVGAAVGAAAPSAGALLFGGGSSGGSGGGSSGSKDNSPKESTSAGSSKGFYGDEEEPVDKASLFTGGGLFGGGNAGNNSSSAAVSAKTAKYGVASEGGDFESQANPFMS